MRSFVLVLWMPYYRSTRLNACARTHTLSRNACRRMHRHIDALYKRKGERIGREKALLWLKARVAVLRRGCPRRNHGRLWSG
jgi:hypothetical protein